MKSGNANEIVTVTVNVEELRKLIREIVYQELSNMFSKGQINCEQEQDNSTKQPIVSEENNLEQTVTQFLHDMGVPTHIKGFTFLRDAVILGVEDIQNISLVTKVLYPGIAKKHQTIPTRVERAIRHAIEVAWSKGNNPKIDEVFGYTISPSRGKPTNSEFISMIVDKIRLNYPNFRKD